MKLELKEHFKREPQLCIVLIGIQNEPALSSPGTRKWFPLPHSRLVPRVANGQFKCLNTLATCYRMPNALRTSLTVGTGGRCPPRCRYLCVYVDKSYLKNFYAAQANSMAGKTCFVATCWRKWLENVAAAPQAEHLSQSKSVCLTRTHTRTCLGSDFIQFDFLSVRVSV